MEDDGFRCRRATNVAEFPKDLTSSKVLVETWDVNGILDGSPDWTSEIFILTFKNVDALWKQDFKSKDENHGSP
ncbi:hypothetical protein PsorP6_003218 [Peronosclerospora sorghi]|uniref:Uncharacterized protein n=1 Tax=Peronosclerospora sorghi TaxID=230839 RepID=A0ACC0VLT6_9STRA|nr:hypothetical protein PsorP6_003218 [Peronosclerospora sorghi]